MGDPRHPCQKREALLHKIQQKAYDDVRFMPIWEPAFLCASGPRVAVSGLNVHSFAYSAPFTSSWRCMMTRNTRWLSIIPLIICVSAVLVHQHRGRDRDIWNAREARGALREHTVGVLTADAVAAVRTAHEALAQNRWAEAAALTPSGEVAGSHVPLVWAVTYYARAVGTAGIHQTVRSRQDLEELRLLRDGLVATRQGDWAAHVELLSRVAAAWVAQREGQHEEALQHMYAAADLEDRSIPHPVMLELSTSARELLGEMLLEHGEFARAVRVFETAIERAPHRGNALYRAARAAELANDLAKTQGFYALLLESTDSTTNDRMKFAQARAFLANLTVILP
jgi:tetratricopeptide (TPR) repeat protein